MEGTSPSQASATAATNKNSVTIQIPEGAEPGDVLNFVVERKELEIAVPEFSQPGDVLEIQLGGGVSQSQEKTTPQDANHTSSQASGSDSDKGVTIIINVGEKEEGRELRFSTLLQKTDAVYSEESKTEDSAGKMKTNETSKPSENSSVDDGTYAHPWPTGLAMSDFWKTKKAKDWIGSAFPAKNNDRIRPINVLELGSGLGLVGLSLAAQFSLLELPMTLQQVILTDVPEGISLLQQNIQANSSLLPSSAEIRAQPLLWSTKPMDLPNIINAGNFLLLASDVLYNSEYIPALIETVKTLLGDNYDATEKDDDTSNGVSTLLLGVRWRKPTVERKFFAALDGWKGRQWQLVHTLHCPLSWKEYGNALCDASNQYFHQTMISVQGKPHPLAELVGDTPSSRMEQMADDEAEAFENCHIQIYALGESTDVTEEKSSKPASSVGERRKRPREDKHVNFEATGGSD